MWPFHRNPRSPATKGDIDSALALLSNQYSWVQSTLNILRAQGEKMSTQMQALTDKVNALKTVDDSAIALLGGLSQQLKDALANNDLPAIQALADSVDAEAAKMAAAITANTPAA
jgi:predicted RecB family nuclease